MRVINNNQTEYKAKCPKCDAILAITKADIRMGWFNAYTICPVCKRKSIICDKDLHRFFK